MRDSRLHVLRLRAVLIACLLGVLLARPALAAAAEFTAPVVKVVDGDTLVVLINGETRRIRLHGIDAPEKRQPFSRRAKRFAADLALGRTVTVREISRDKYGRIVAEVILPDGRVLNEELVRAGLAWWYCRDSADEHLAALEREARAARRGLWGDPNPIAPWDFRRPGRPPQPACQ
jgi:endonuclease YncB( thermonuclease family)